MSAVQEKSTELVIERGPYSKREETLPATQSQPANLMQALAAAAANPQMDVAKIERLWAMHKEMMDREREAAFNDALSRAQANIQPIATDARNDHTKSRYATLAAINEALVPIYTAEGLSVSFDSFDPERDKGLPALKEGWQRVIGFLSHRGGHTRKYYLDGPLDDAGKDGTKNKTGIQAVGSTSSYLQRYLERRIFNVTSFDDDDGNGGGNGSARLDEKKLADHLAKMEESANEADMLKAFAVGYNAAEDLKDKDSQRVLLAKRDECRKKLKARRP